MKTYSICELRGRAQEPIKLFDYAFKDQEPQIGDEIWLDGQQPRRISRRIWREDGTLLIIVSPIGLASA